MIGPKTRRARAYGGRGRRGRPIAQKMTSARRRVIHVLKLQGMPIFDQLMLEEALFRVDSRRWFVWNQQSRSPSVSVVLGIGGKVDKLVHRDLAEHDKIPLIKRFSGGGTVVVDENTIFTSFILDRGLLPHVNPYPKDIMRWSGDFYEPIFNQWNPPEVSEGLRAGS